MDKALHILFWTCLTALLFGGVLREVYRTLRP